MLLLRRQKQGGGLDEWVYSDLPVCHAGGGGRLWLGVPTVLKHVVDEQSPLFGMELEVSGCNSGDGPCHCSHQGASTVAIADGRCALLRVWAPAPAP